MDTTTPALTARVLQRIADLAIPQIHVASKRSKLPNGGAVWRRTELIDPRMASTGYLPPAIMDRLRPGMPNPAGSPGGVWYASQADAVADLLRVVRELMPSE